MCPAAATAPSPNMRSRTASMLLRRFAWADAEISAGNYAAFRAKLLADNLAGIEGLLVGIVGFRRHRRGGGARPSPKRAAGSAIYDPAPSDPKADAAAMGAATLAARRAAAESRHCEPARAAAAGDAGLIGGSRAREHEKGRGADPGRARRHRRRSGARRQLRAGRSAAPRSTSIRPSRPAPDNPLLTLDRGRRPALAAHAAHRRRDAPVGGIPVPDRVAKRRARAGEPARRPCTASY